MDTPGRLPRIAYRGNAVRHRSLEILPESGEVALSGLRVVTIVWTILPFVVGAIVFVVVSAVREVPVQGTDASVLAGLCVGGLVALVGFIIVAQAWFDRAADARTFRDAATDRLILHCAGNALVLESTRALIEVDGHSGVRCLFVHRGEFANAIAFDSSAGPLVFAASPSRATWSNCQFVDGPAYRLGEEEFDALLAWLGDEPYRAAFTPFSEALHDDVPEQPT